MNINFPLILVLLAVVSGAIWLIDYIFFSVNRKLEKRKEPWWVDYARSFFPIFVIVIIIRSFIFQLYRVPTGSLVPTILPGDMVLVEQFAYGLRLPVTGTKILDTGMPKRGDIAVFKFPPQPSVNYIKRIVGLPGDHIMYKNRVLYINGKKANQKIVGNMNYDLGTKSYPDQKFSAEIRSENLDGVKHNIIINKEQSEDTVSDYKFTVPNGYYFAMGDNRDDSSDSRFWGFVPEKDLVGKAYRIIFSWDSNNDRVRWSRIGSKV